MLRLLSLRLILATFGFVLMGAPNASATLINFDSLAHDEIVTSQFSALGVEFSGTKVAPVSLPAPYTEPNGIYSDTVTFQPTLSTALKATFSGDAATQVTILGNDVGETGFQLDAYDSLFGGTLVDTAIFIGPGDGVGTSATLSVFNVLGIGIRRVEFYRPFPLANSADGIVFDNFEFFLDSGSGPALPEPSSLAIFALGLAGLGFMRRRRKLH